MEVVAVPTATTVAVVVATAIKGMAAVATAIRATAAVAVAQVEPLELRLEAASARLLDQAAWAEPLALQVV
jgi:hypothetical protein